MLPVWESVWFEISRISIEDKGMMPNIAWISIIKIIFIVIIKLVNIIKPEQAMRTHPDIGLMTWGRLYKKVIKVNYD